MLDDLGKQVVRKPALATNPMFVGLTRLALTASGHAKEGVHILPPPAPPAPPPVTPLPPIVFTEVQERSLMESVEECISLMRKHGMTLDMESVRRLRETLNEVAPDTNANSIVESLERRLRDATERERILARQAETSKTLMEGAQKTLRDAERDNTSLREQHALAKRNADEFKKRLEAAQEDVARVTAEAEEVKQVAKGAVLRTLATLEWSAKSKDYNNRRTGAPMACCPSCAGLEPSGLSPGRGVGHQKGCTLAKLISEASGG